MLRLHYGRNHPNIEVHEVQSTPCPKGSRELTHPTAARSLQARARRIALLERAQRADGSVDGSAEARVVGEVEYLERGGERGRQGVREVVVVEMQLDEHYERGDGGGDRPGHVRRGEVQKFQRRLDGSAVEENRERIGERLVRDH